MTLGYNLTAIITQSFVILWRQYLPINFICLSKSRNKKAHFPLFDYLVLCYNYRIKIGSKLIEEGDNGTCIIG